MIDASYELQIAIVGRLKSFAPLTDFIADRVYDDVPRDPVTKQVTADFPYVAFDNDQVIPDNFDCITGSEIYIDISAWSRAVGSAEVKKIANAVRLALHEFELPLTENALVSFEFYKREVERDPDGKTRRARMTFLAVVEHD
ncbi:DUF3168 domain-containing protein [Mesorhizobium sp. B2-4-4]|uniref:DUF3168 domain-containing protein n=1 Tax=Mesorhizobium sp. B2-4-4 TaxID=2589945 RepID=UPI00112E61E2|nr:DUF3168 domain-containing protein [Mesorhizobium sp. B2-4-4]TPL49230.1 DUF3168 domain-containing protein [Mesorhizobium sp. B2-4-4]